MSRNEKIFSSMEGYAGRNGSFDNLAAEGTLSDGYVMLTGSSAAQQRANATATPTSQTVEMGTLAEQNRRLKDELESVSMERDAAQEAIDRVLPDLLAAQTELEEARQKVADRDTEMARLKEEIFRLSTQGYGNDRCYVDPQRQFNNQHERPELPGKTSEATAQLREKDEALQAKTRELAEQVSEMQLQENKLRQQLAQVQTVAAEDRRQREAAEAKVEEPQAGPQLRGSHAAEVAELRRLLAFHKTNGEQVSKQARETQAANRSLQIALQDKERLLSEQNSDISALRLQVQGKF